MEATLRKYIHGGQLNFEEKTAADKASSGEDDQYGYSKDFVIKFGNGRSKRDEHNTDIDDREQADLLESAKVEMVKVTEENQRLKKYLDQIMKDYKSLQMKFRDVVQQETTNTSLQEEEEETEFVSLSLGRSSSTELKKPENSGRNCNKEKVDGEEEEEEEGLGLALDNKFKYQKNQQIETSPNPKSEISLEEIKETGSTKRAVDDDVSQQNPNKRARVSVRVRCETPTMNDGCQWRKYGQKIAKGNPCPRAYYRCTIAPNCPVRKQVQRCADDMSILTTTYEGIHNHPLPMSATTIASTTSAAACMLLSGSTTSRTSSTTSTNVTLNSSNFHLSENYKLFPPFYIPNSSISTSPSYPTITLDLTTNPLVASNLNKMSNLTSPRYSTTNLNFGTSLDSLTNGMLNYGNQSNYINNNNIINQVGNYSLSFGKQPLQENIYQSYIQNGILNSSHQQQSFPTDTIKAITSNPSFQSALSAALTSIMGSGGSNNNEGVSSLNKSNFNGDKRDNIS